MTDNSVKISVLDFDNIVNSLKDVTGKTESLYVIVLFKCTSEELLEYTLSRSQNALKIKDSHRRGRARKAYNTLKEFGETFLEKYVFNHLIVMDVERDTLDAYSLTNRMIHLLSSYECTKIWLRCTDYFNLDELRDYLESDEHFNLFRIKNNQVKHIKLGRTKKVVIHTEESKTLDLPNYIETRLKSMDKAKYLVYGVSSKLASISESPIHVRAYDVINHDISDEDAIEYIARMVQSNILDEMDADLDMMQNPKTMHRILFKKDFTPNTIANVKRMYIDKRNKDRFLGNCKKNNIDVSFELVVIDSTIKDFQENRECRLMNEFDGVIGVSYY